MMVTLSDLGIDDRILIIGAGRHAAECFYLSQDIYGKNIVEAFVVDDHNSQSKFMGLPVFMLEDILIRYKNVQKRPKVIVAIGASKPNKKLTKIFLENGFDFCSFVHPLIRKERQHYLGKGISIAEGTVLTCNVTVDDFSIVNIGCTISHDCIIGKFVNISPGCHIAGWVNIEDEVFIGTGVTIIPHIKVGKGSVIAAGSVVIENVDPYTMVAGVPAKKKKDFEP